MQQASIEIQQQKNDLSSKINLVFHSKIKNVVGIRKYIRNFKDVFFTAIDKTTFGIICDKIENAKNLYENFGLTINNLIFEIWKNKNIKKKYFYREQDNIIEIEVNNELGEKSENEIVNFNENNNSQTFDNFITSNENITIYELCKSIACANDKEFIGSGSIVHLYGETSTGKTHLLNAISNFYQKLGGKVCYFTSSSFLRQYINSVKKQDCISFQDKILQNDIILIDNIDNLVGKNGTLTALKQILSFALEQQKYVVLTSKLNSTFLSTNSNTLKNILSKAISLELKPVDVDTKTKIIMRYIAEKNKNLSISLAQPIVEQMNCNICELKNCVKKLSIIQKVKQFEINTALALSILNNDFKKEKNENKKTTSNENIINAVAKYYKIKPEDITSKIKTSNVCLARNIVMFLMRDLNSVNYQEIGKILNRNHSTIISGIKNITNMLENDAKMPSIIAEIKTNL